MRISEFQQLINDIYGERDRERGLSATVAWRAEEVGELAQAVRNGDAVRRANEFGDVLVWLASLANQLDLSLDDAAARYAGGCPRVRRLHAPANSGLRYVVAHTGPRGDGGGTRWLESSQAALRSDRRVPLVVSVLACPPPERVRVS